MTWKRCMSLIEISILEQKITLYRKHVCKPSRVVGHQVSVHLRWDLGSLLFSPSAPFAAFQRDWGHSMTLMGFFISLTVMLKGSSTTLAAHSPVHWLLKSPSHVDAREFDMGFVRSTLFSQASSESFRWSSSLHEARSGVELRLRAIDEFYISSNFRLIMQLSPSRQSLSLMVF